MLYLVGAPAGRRAPPPRPPAAGRRALLDGLNLKTLSKLPELRLDRDVGGGESRERGAGITFVRSKVGTPGHSSLSIAEPELV